MLSKNRNKQQEMELVTYDLLVPKDHLLRKIDAAIDFRFIYKLCAPLYCLDNGRPAIDPGNIVPDAVCGISVWHPF